jgi:hypothetical protein
MKNKQTINEKIVTILDAVYEHKLEEVKAHESLKSLILDVVQEALSVNEGTWIGQTTLQRAKEILGMEVEE